MTGKKDKRIQDNIRVCGGRSENLVDRCKRAMTSRERRWVDSTRLDDEWTLFGTKNSR